MTTEPPLDEPAPKSEAPALDAQVLAKMREFKATGLGWLEYQALCAMGQLAVDCVIQAETERQDGLARLTAGYFAWATGGNPELLAKLIGDAELEMDIAALMATRRAVRRGR